MPNKVELRERVAEQICKVVGKHIYMVHWEDLPPAENEIIDYLKSKEVSK